MKEITNFNVREASPVYTFRTLLTYGEIAAELNIPELWKEYLATLACELFGQDTESGIAFLKNPELLTNDPLEILRKMGNSSTLQKSDRPDHPFQLIKKDQKELEKRIRKAQIKVCLPLIETERSLFVTVQHGRILAILGSDFWDDRIEEYRTFGYNALGLIADDPYDLDVTSIYQLSLLRKRLAMLNTFSYAAFFNMFPEDRKRLGFLSGLWRKLTGSRLCVTEELDQLFSGHDDFMNRD